MARPSPQTDRVVALIELLRARPDHALTLADVTRRLQVNKSTCHAMLSSLSGAGWLLRDPARKTYRLGPALVAVGRAAAAGFPALELAHATMVELSAELHLHCAALAVSDDAVTVLDRVAAPHAAGNPQRIGIAYPLRPPFGSAVVAWADERHVAAWLDHVPQARHERYRAALAATRRRGFAVELSSPPAESVLQVVGLLREALDTDGATPMRAALDQLVDVLAEQDDYLPIDLVPDRAAVVNAVNAPVLDRDGRVSLIMSLTGFGPHRSGADVAAVGSTLVKATAALTAALGGRP